MSNVRYTRIVDSYGEGSGEQRHAEFEVLEALPQATVHKYVVPGTGPRADLGGQGEESVAVGHHGDQPGPVVLMVNDGYRPAHIALTPDVARQVAGWLEASANRGA